MLVIKASVPTFRADVHSISQRWLDMDWNVISEITPKLYLSAVSAITNASLADHNITLIINASKELPIFPTEDVKIFSVRVPVYDATDQDLYPYFLVSVEHLCLNFKFLASFWTTNSILNLVNLRVDKSKRRQQWIHVDSLHGWKKSQCHINHSLFIMERWL